MSSQDSTLYKKMQSSKRKAISHFNDSKYGMFIHWGLYAIPGGIWKNQRMEDLKGPKVAEWILTTSFMGDGVNMGDYYVQIKKL